MNKGITVKELMNYCAEQIKKGNGNKHILISTDDEGNGYHTLFYQFLDNADDIKMLKENGLFHDNNDADDVVLLG